MRSYTSLGEKTNTLPNPHLMYFDETTGQNSYRPAYMLKHSDELERIGRFVPEPKRSVDCGEINCVRP